jgi:hypothetical protein
MVYKILITLDNCEVLEKIAALEKESPDEGN